jgi:Predicted permease
VTEPIIGQLVEPMLYGRSTGLSPISVVISAIFWGWLWGPVGLILSTPLTLCLVVLGRHVKQLEFLNVLFGDRPALTRVENFYQRVLAGDPDEVQEHAEELLKEMSLSSYYDEVALKGLELAARDLARGVLTRPQVERIKEAVTTWLGNWRITTTWIRRPRPKRPLTEAPRRICPSIRPPTERCPRA